MVEPTVLEPTVLAPAADANLVVGTLRKPTTVANEALYWVNGRLALAKSAPATTAVALLAVLPASDSPAAMVCIRDGSKSLVYAEVASAPDDSSQRSLLERALLGEDCLPETLRPVESGAFELDGRDLNGHPSEGVHPRLYLAYRRPVRHFSLFPDTPVVAPSKWKPLQTKPD
jgi:hypothetical protein